MISKGVKSIFPIKNQEIWDRYKQHIQAFWTTEEVSQKTVIDMSADRAPFIDQTQSMNLWLSTPTFGKVNSMHMYAWKKGLKTGMYYLRSRSAVDAVKVTVSSEKAAKDAYINTTICLLYTSPSPRD